MLAVSRALCRSALHGGVRVPATSGAWMVAQKPWFSTKKEEEPDSHDDFMPEYNTNAGSDEHKDVHSVITEDITKNTIMVYMKGTPEAPQCGFSNMTCRILDAYGVQYGSRNVLADQELRDAIKTFTGWPTIPQVFFEGEFIGGSDILMSMHQEGQLEESLPKAPPQ